jgi:hypothetical protein
MEERGVPSLSCTITGDNPAFAAGIQYAPRITPQWTLQLRGTGKPE